jgi:hypothetical protein
MGDSTRATRSSHTKDPANTRRAEIISATQISGHHPYYQLWQKKSSSLCR